MRPLGPVPGDGSAARRMLGAQASMVANAKGQAEAAARQEARDEALAEARARLVSEAMARMDVSLRFSVDQSSGMVMLLVVDRGSGKVLRTVSLEYFMKAVAGFQDATGLLLDEGI